MTWALSLTQSHRGTTKAVPLTDRNRSRFPADLRQPHLAITGQALSSSWSKGKRQDLPNSPSPEQLNY